MSETVPETVFVSYRTSDDGAAREINELVPVLEEKFGKGRVFYDKKSMEPGLWAEQIKRTLPVVEVVVVLVCDHDDWLRGIEADAEPTAKDLIDDWVKWEVETALEAAREAPDEKLVVPLFLKDPAGLFDKLPASMKGLSDWQSKQLLSDPGLGKRREEFVLWVWRTAQKSQGRLALLEEIQAPLRTQKALNSFVEQKPRVWAYFRASLGILTRHDELVREVEPGKVPSTDAMLEVLDSFKDRRPLFRFLGLMLFHKVDGATLSLPEKVSKAWNEILDSYIRWELSAGDDEAVAEWRQQADCLRPVIQLIFCEGYGDAGQGIRIDGTVRWGQEPKPVELAKDWVDWRPSRGEEKLWEALQPVFRELLGEAEQWLGPRSDWHTAFRPKMELFFSRSQQRWPLELTPVQDGTPVGAIFRVVRRLYERHFGDGGAGPWKEACEQFSDPVKLKSVHQAERWDEVGACKPKHHAFRCPEPMGERDAARLENWVCGTWPNGSESTDTTDLEDVLTGEEPCEEYARRLCGLGTYVAVLLDRSPEVAPVAKDLSTVVAAERNEEEDDLESEY